jgi:hypothetical protein
MSDEPPKPSKPSPSKRRPSFDDFVDEHLDEQGDWVWDAGTFGDDTAGVPDAPKRGRGRPRVYARKDMVQVLKWYLANETPSFPLEGFHGTLKNWLGAKTPSISSVRRWLDELRQQPRAPQL